MGRHGTRNETFGHSHHVVTYALSPGPQHFVGCKWMFNSKENQSKVGPLEDRFNSRLVAKNNLKWKVRTTWKRLLQSSSSPLFVPFLCNGFIFCLILATIRCRDSISFVKFWVKVLLEQPDGSICNNEPNLVRNLTKVLYGSKQASCKWKKGN